MGCFSSKGSTEKTSDRGRNAASAAGRHSASSQDSGIGLSCPNPSSTVFTESDPGSEAIHTKNKKGIAFDVSVSRKGIIKQHPPRKKDDLGSRPSSRKSNTLPSISPRRLANPPAKLLQHRNASKPITAEEIQRKQEEAERKREMDRLAKLARLHRRDLRAQKIKERRQQQKLWETDTEEDLSDVDQTFNNDDEFHWDETSERSVQIRDEDNGENLPQTPSSVDIQSDLLF